MHPKMTEKEERDKIYAALEIALETDTMRGTESRIAAMADVSPSLLAKFKASGGARCTIDTARKIEIGIRKAVTSPPQKMGKQDAQDKQMRLYLAEKLSGIIKILKDPRIPNDFVGEEIGGLGQTLLKAGEYLGTVGDKGDETVVNSKRHE